MNHNCPLGPNNTLAPGASCTLEVTFVPAVAGCDESARVRIDDNARDSPQVIELIGRRPSGVGSLCIPAVGCAAPVP